MREEEQSIAKYRRYYKYIEPVINDPVTRSYASLILFFLTVSFFIAFAIRPTVKTIVSLNKQIQDGKATDNALQEKINALSLAQSEYNSLTPAFPLIYSSLPEKAMTGEFISMIEKIATASNVTLANLQIQTVKLLEKDTPDQQGEAIRELVFTLSVEGKYRSLKSFTEILRRIRRIVSVENILVQPARDKKANNLNLILTGKAYFFK